MPTKLRVASGYHNSSFLSILSSSTSNTKVAPPAAKQHNQFLRFVLQTSFNVVHVSPKSFLRDLECTNSCYLTDSGYWTPFYR